MTTLPQAPETFFAERAGVVAVAALVNRMRCIWRETPNGDVGIDGQIEYVAKDGSCTGQVIAAQIKSGPTFFRHEAEDSFLFYPDKKHRHYWQNYPMPVIVVLYDPSKNIGYWTDARRSLRSPYTSGDAAIRVPKDQELVESNKAKLFEGTGPVGGKFFSIAEVLVELAKQECREAAFNLSFLDLFGFGLVDIGRQLFFSMGLCLDLAQVRADEHGFEAGGSSDAYIFIEQYIRFLVAQNLIHYDFSDFLIQWEEREMTPVFIAPLTPRGREVVHKLHEYEGANENVFYEASLGLALHIQVSLLNRLPAAKEIRSRILNNDRPSESQA